MSRQRNRGKPGLITAIRRAGAEFSKRARRWEFRAVEQFEKRDIPTRPVIRIKNSKKITIID